jgi:diaminopimelate epimerase
MHGLGNDFVVINNLLDKHQFSASEIQLLANRKFGIGCDQVLLVEAASDGVSDFFYRIYNADGSKAGQCGNGARCFIRYVIDHGLTLKQSLQLQTESRVIQGQRLPHGDIQVNMGQAEFSTELIPLNLEFADHYAVEIKGEIIHFAALSMGNPHAVIELDRAELLEDDSYLQSIGEFLQGSRLFPDSVNVNFIFRRSQAELALRTYERGCGSTLACGSGACASAVVAIRDKLVSSPVRINMLGGSLVISWDGYDVIMAGSATPVFAGEIEL